MLPESQITEKDGKLQVSVEYIDWLENERRKVNKVDLANIEFYQNDKKIDIPGKRVKRFKFVGLTNFCFITTGFFEEEDDDSFWQHLIDKPV